MKKFILAAAFGAAAVVAAPAQAAETNQNEIRVEARGGVYWMDGVTEGVVGAAAGYDLALGELGFVGAEVSADKILAEDTNVVFGVSARAGLKTNETGKFYVAGGWASKVCGSCKRTWNVGFGLQQGIVGDIYVKGEFRHFFPGDDLPTGNAAVVGLGMNF